MLKEQDILSEIRAWHSEERKSSIRRTFELGDLILKAVRHTGRSEYDVISHIMDDLGELSMAQTTYNRAARMARVFTKRQRQVLIDKAVSLARCEILAGDFYTGRKRIATIYSIRTGKIKPPWSCIKGVREATGTQRFGVKVEKERAGNSAKNPDILVVSIVKNGEPDEEAIVNALKNVISRIGNERAQRLWLQALREVKA